MFEHQASVLLATALIATTDQAAPLKLSDSDLSAVAAGDNSIQLQAPSANNVQNSLAGFFGASSLQASSLTPAQFFAAMAALDTALPASFYVDQPVTEILISMAPISIQTNLQSLLTGLDQGASQSATLSGPSMGSISLNSLTATGTRVYLWSH